MPSRSQVALLHYTSRNLGDDIQAFAVRSFVGGDRTLDRDRLQQDSPRCDFVLFGWPLQSRQWPPSPKLRTHPISIHVTLAARDLLAEHIDWWRPLETISCRDTSTAAFFLNHDIRALFDGCTTLSLRRWLEPEAGCAVLVDIDTARHGTPSLEFQNVIRKTHKIPPGRTSDQPYRRAAARDALEAYQRAELVVTSRLHAMLPCSARRLCTFPAAIGETRRSLRVCSTICRMWKSGTAARRTDQAGRRRIIGPRRSSTISLSG